MLQGGVTLIYGVDIVNKNVSTQDIPLIIFLFAAFYNMMVIMITRWYFIARNFGSWQYTCIGM